MSRFHYVFTILAAVILSVSAAYAAQWQAHWNDTSFIKTGGVIPAQKVGENFEYLKKQVEDFENCDFQRMDGVACKFTYNCNCGKYGCSTCTLDSTRSNLRLTCPNKEPIIFEGACHDPRQSQDCGKYGCTNTHTGGAGNWTNL